MLERHALLLRAWAPPAGRPPDRGRAGAEGPPPGSPTRAVLDPGTGEPLGFVSRRRPAWPWLGWLVRPALEVYETEDASLLCTLHGPWALTRGWEVRDADDRLVGVCRGAAAWDRFGGCLGVLTRAGEGGLLRCVSPQGAELC